MAKISGPNIGVTASAGNVKVVMSEVQRELDRINATPLSKLRDTSEDALEAVNKSVAGTVANLAKLKTELASSGKIDNRLLKATEKQFEALKRFGIDPKLQRQIDDTLGQVDGRGSRTDRAKAIREEREDRARVQRADRDAAQKKSDQERIALVQRTRDEVRVEQIRRGERAKSLRAERAESIASAVREEAARFGESRRLTSRRSGGSGNGGTGGGPNGASDEQPGNLRDAVGIFDAATGGRKFDVNKGLKFGLAGVVAGFVSDTLAQASEGALEARNQGGNALLGGIGSLPIVSGIANAAANIYEIYTGIGQATATVSANWDRERKAVESINSLLNQRLKLIADSDRLIQNQSARFAASQQGGKAGRIAGIEAEFGADSRDISAQRLDRQRQIQAETEAALAPLKQEEIKLKVQRSNAGDPDTRAQINSQILSNQVSQSKIAGTGKERIDESNKALKEQQDLLNNIYNTEIGVAEGRFANQKAIDDGLQGLRDQIDTVSADPIVQLRKEFEKLNPGSMVEINKTLDEYQKRQRELEKERRAFSATEGARQLLETPTSIGGPTIDQQVNELVNAGVKDQALIAKVRIRLETDEAKRAAEDLKKSLQDIALNIGVTLARGIRDRVRAEVEAEDARRRRETGVGLSPAQRQQLEKARLDESFAADAARTRDAAKTPQEKLGETLDSLTEQFRRGFINDRELRFGVGSGIQDLADASRTERTALITGEDKGAAQQLLALSTGAVVDASKPELVLAKEANSILAEINSAIRENRRVRVAITN